MTNTHQKTANSSADSRAKAFVDARLAAQCVSVYPGSKPASLKEAYSVQNDAIELWPAPIGGWKVGRINPPFETEFGADRLVGPVFQPVCHKNSDAVLDMPVFETGFAAVEGEVTAVIAKDVPWDKTSFTIEDALYFIKSLNFGVEIASSPFPEINDHGPLVTISDFGNNYGLILGDEIENWRDMTLEDWVFETIINGQSVGRASPTGLPGGPVESVRYLLENTSRRGLPLKAGMCVLTGAVTGVHQAFVGDTASVTLADQKISISLSAVTV